MFKFLKSLLVSVILFFAFVGVARAELMIQSIEMPNWVNWQPLSISYTALETENKPVEVKGFIKKDGEGWQEIGSSTKLSDTFKISRSYYPGDGVYKIYFKEINSGKTTPEESFKVDFTAPSGVSEYRKERKDANVYKICWKNPNDDDFNRVLIFRSDKTNEGFSKVGEVSGSKNEEKCFENGTPDNRDYYYLTRAVDHAGNASVTIGDSEVTTTQVLGVADKEEAGTPEEVVILPLAEGTGGSEAQEGQILGGTTDEEEISQPGVVQQVAQQVARWGWLRILGVVIVLAGIIVLIISLLKKRS